MLQPVLFGIIAICILAAYIALLLPIYGMMDKIMKGVDYDENIKNEQAFTLIEMMIVFAYYFSINTYCDSKCDKAFKVD